MYRNVRSVLAKYRGLLIIDINKEEDLFSYSSLWEFSEMDLFPVMKVVNIFWNVLPYTSFLRRNSSENYKYFHLKLDKIFFYNMGGGAHCAPLPTPILIFLNPEFIFGDK